MNNRYGYIAPIRTTKSLVFGSDHFVDPILMLGGHGWGAYLPADERQMMIDGDTYACTVFGTLNALEIISKHKTKNSYNFSDRYGAIGGDVIAGIGGDPVKVFNAFAKNIGVIDEPYLPLRDGMKLEEFYSPKPLTHALLDRGKKWLKTHELKMEWVPTDANSMKDALQYSPLCVAVYAWVMGPDGKYIRPPNGQDIHWTTLYDYVDGDYWMVYDSSNNTHLRLAWDFGFTTIFRYAILDKIPDPSWYENLIRSLVAVLAQLGLAKAPQEAFQTVIKATVDEIEANTPDTPVSQPVDTQITHQTDTENDVQPKYVWDSPEASKHSFRVICDEEGLNWGEKNLLCAVLMAESGFKMSAVNENRNAKGEVTSRDWGIYQFNDYWYIEKMHLITIEQAKNDPEFGARLFIKRYKAGFLKDWVGYISGAYKLYLV